MRNGNGYVFEQETVFDLGTLGAWLLMLTPIFWFFNPSLDSPFKSLAHCWGLVLYSLLLHDQSATTQQNETRRDAFR